MPGGVNSPVRCWQSVGGAPLLIASGNGTELAAVDGSRYLDFCGSWGPLILGHAHPEVVEAVQRTAAEGLTFGATTVQEIEFAELLLECIPYVDQVRLVNSGTEAVMTALRLARGVTGRTRILKFDGCYHGHSDAVLVSAGSGLLTGGRASSDGISADTARQTLVAPFNDLDRVADVMAAKGDDIAAIIVEPVAGNMGLIPPADGFLEGLRELSTKHGALLIFDEVITGFRLGPTTFGAIHGVTPDITCLGKIIGGGMPIGAIAGPRRIMEHLAPVGAVYQAGTLSGNPIAVAAGLATLRILHESDPYADICRRATAMSVRLNSHFENADLNAWCAQLGGMFTIFFTRPPVHNLQQAKTSDTTQFAAYFHHMLSRGVYLPPSQFEVSFTSAAHTDAEMDRFARTVIEVVDLMKAENVKSQR